MTTTVRATKWGRPLFLAFSALGQSSNIPSISESGTPYNGALSYVIALLHGNISTFLIKWEQRKPTLGNPPRDLRECGLVRAAVMKVLFAAHIISIGSKAYLWVHCL